MYISRFWHEFKHRCPLYRTDRNQHSYNVTIQRIHPDFPFGGFILYSLIRRNNKFTLSAESSECGYCTYHGCFLFVNLLETKILSHTNGDLSKYKPIHSGLFVSCVLALGGLSINYLTQSSNDWIISVFMLAGILITVYKIMQVMQVKSLIHQVCIYLLCILICLPSLHAPYLSGSILLILICFHYGYKAECAAALLLFIYAISKYYYDLDITLLTKSITLFCTGIVLLIAWYVLTQKKTRHEKI